MGLEIRPPQTQVQNEIISPLSLYEPKIHQANEPNPQNDFGGKNKYMKPEFLDESQGKSNFRFWNQ